MRTTIALAAAAVLLFLVALIGTQMRPPSSIPISNVPSSTADRRGALPHLADGLVCQRPAGYPVPTLAVPQVALPKGHVDADGLVRCPPGHQTCVIDVLVPQYPTAASFPAIIGRTQR